MEMLVEVFVDQEIENESDTERELRCKASERLGLRGQQAIGTGFRYRVPSAEELMVYRTLFPRAVKVEDYSDEAIPMRVIDVLEAATNSGVFRSFHVWCPETRGADPVLVGRTMDSRGEWYGQEIILARWGTALDEFPALLKKARIAVVESVRARASEAMARAEVALRQLREMDIENCNIVRVSQINV